jgi:hypothetical protein
MKEAPMFEVIHGHNVNNHSWPIDKVDAFETDSALHLAPRFILAGWTVTFADDELVTAEFGVRWIQISRVLGTY